jgi:hypothetical protein
MTRLLTIPQHAAEALSPAQRKFNQLQQQIDKAKSGLRAWDEAVPPFASAYAQSVQPLLEQAEEATRHLALRIEAWLAEKGWSAGEREVLEAVLVDLAREVIEGHGLPPAQAAEWKARHDRHADLGFDAGTAHELEVLKRMFEHQTGVDLEDEAFDDEDELLARVRQKLQQRADEQAAESEQHTKAAAKPPRKPTAAQARRQAEREAAAQAAQQSLRLVFRKLASHLHPDRASDPEDAARRTALMQRANAAYAAEDLLALLGLQLELEQIDAAHLKSASDAQIRHFNAVLQEQLDELKAELALRERRFCAEFSLRPRSASAINPAKLGTLLAHAQADARAEVFEVERDFSAVLTREGARRWVKRVKAAAREQAGYF